MAPLVRAPILVAFVGHVHAESSCTADTPSEETTLLQAGMRKAVNHLQVAAPGEQSYVGCFVDDGARDFNHGPRSGGGTGYTFTTCRDACQGYEYLSLQYGGQCFCDNEYGGGPYISRPDSECQMDRDPCSGESHACGGGWRNAVYLTAVGPSNAELRAHIEILHEMGAQAVDDLWNGHEMQNAGIDANRQAIDHLHDLGHQAIDELHGAVGETHDGIDANRQAINDLSDMGHQAIDDLHGAVGETHDRIDANRQAINDLSDMGHQAVEDLHGAVGETHERIDELHAMGSEAINGLQDQVDSLEERFDALESQVEGLQGHHTSDGCLTSNYESGEHPLTLQAGDFTAAVRCCSSDGSTCQTRDLPESVEMDVVNFEGNTVGSVQSCVMSATFTDAEAICTEAGMRLCSSDELNTGTCCGTGCWHDHRAIWVSE